LDHGETGFVLEPPEAMQERKTEKEPENSGGGHCNSQNTWREFKVTAGHRVQGNSRTQSSR